MLLICRERKVLENKRLDLDACKNRVRKARAMLDQQQVGYSTVRLLVHSAQHYRRRGSTLALCWSR